MAKQPKNKAGPHLPPIAGEYMKRMGDGDFAQAPQDKCVIKQWPRSLDPRSGVTNDFRQDAMLVSDLRENLQWDELHGYFPGAEGGRGEG